MWNWAATSFRHVISPGMLREFVYGNLRSEGIISSPGDLTFYREKPAMAGWPGSRPG